MKSVFCAIDFSEASLQVLRLAAQQAEVHSGKVVVLYSYRLVQSAGKPVAEYRREVEQAAKENFQKLTQSLTGKEISVLDFRMEIGFFTDRIEVYASKGEIELLVLSKGMASKYDEHSGILLTDFLDSLKIPVMVVS
jgi:hypothetical protein